MSSLIRCLFLPLTCFLIFAFFLHILFFPLLPPFSHPLFVSSRLTRLLTLSDQRQIVLSKEGNRAGGRQILCFSRGASSYECVYVCVAHCWTLDSRVIRFPVTACDLKSHEWGPVDSWPGACCRGRGNGWHLEIMASWDNMAVELGQGWKAYCQMYSITADSLLNIVIAIRKQSLWLCLLRFVAAFNSFLSFIMQS